MNNMALFCSGRLGSKPFMATIIGRIPFALSAGSFAQASTAAPKITFKKYEAPTSEPIDQRNERLKRPMSPHLTIYALQLTSTLSITHRISGMMLTGYITVLGVGALVLPHDVSHYVTMIEGLHLSFASMFLIKAVLAAPFGYHFANGMRHLYWDTARGLTIKEVYKTGYFMLGTSLLMTAILAAL